MKTLLYVFGPNQKASVMMGMDRFLQSGREFVKITKMLDFTATDLFFPFYLLGLNVTLIKLLSYYGVFSILEKSYCAFSWRKLIGARYFNKGYAAIVGKLNSSFDTPRDKEGHGMHTLSTAGGNMIAKASVFSFGKGTAKVGSPRARVAAYKVCWTPVLGNQCYDADILGGFDVAIHDGVNVLSVSLGGEPTAFFNDSVVIGSFHAIKHGIVVVSSAGNLGPADSTVSNVAPWQITVVASTMDREFSSIVVLRNNMRFKGQSLPAKVLPGKKFFPLISVADAKTLCQAGAIDPKKATVKILVCLRGKNVRVDKGQQAALAGAVGMILANNILTGNEIIVDAHLLPASHIQYTDGLAVLAYIYSTKQPMACITPAMTRIGKKPAPFMAAFSSKGPNTITPEILKPDITAPGVSVIATYTEAARPTNEAFDKRGVKNSTPYQALRLSGTVKYVGSPGTYRAQVRKPIGISVYVKLKMLKFKKVGEEKTFKVTLTVNKARAVKEYVFGQLIWSDLVHYVRSPIVVKAA
ncbi:Subtilisin-like protease SBT5.3 [Hibiscus syriacus]|uniref:Subtilisin-like protease SBT5.3 n=1 Tax=Hibiscus syriacus TaxID=106335 RepID=A0A6A2ZEU9_HIBSY|nr:Subtilisin-like protease SBT5.3 [Hibiscus syriacus]